MLRKYGSEPYTISLVHGGPGGGGEMAPVARNLSDRWGVLEPIQMDDSIAGLVEETRGIIETHAKAPVSIVGHSWGAWLGLMVAAEHPRLVNKLVLVGSGPFEEGFVRKIGEARRSRLTDVEREEFGRIVGLLNGPKSENANSLLPRLGELAAKTDSFDPIHEDESAEDRVDVEDGGRGDIYQKVWSEAAQLRKRGELLEVARKVRCPVIAIHGDYDPHPIAGIEEPLSRVVEDFRLVVLKRCGHTPWMERQAREEFFQVLRAELPSQL